jgi:hypothetical protein
MSRPLQHFVAMGLTAAILFHIAESRIDIDIHGGDSYGGISTSDVFKYLLTTFVFSVGFSSLMLFPAAWLIGWSRQKRYLAFILPIGFPIVFSAFILACFFFELDNSILPILMSSLFSALAASIVFAGYCCILWLERLVILVITSSLIKYRPKRSGQPS